MSFLSFDCMSCRNATVALEINESTILTLENKQGFLLFLNFERFVCVGGWRGERLSAKREFILYQNANSFEFGIHSYQNLHFQLINNLIDC